MKLDTSDCPNPAIDPEGYKAWEKRERDKNPPPDPKVDEEAFFQWVADFCDQLPYKLLPKKRAPEIDIDCIATEITEKLTVKVIEHLKELMDPSKTPTTTPEYRLLPKRPPRGGC